MGKCNGNVYDSEGSLSDMSENQMKELEAEVSSPQSYKPIPTPSSSRKKTQVKHTRKSAEFIAEEIDDESVDKERLTKTAIKTRKPKTKSDSIEIDNGELAGENDKLKPTTKKVLARSGRGVAKVIEKDKKKASPKPYTKISPPRKATPETDSTDAPPPSPKRGATILQMTNKIIKAAKASFEVAEMWEGFLAMHHMPKEERSLRKVQKAIDGIKGKRKFGDDEEADGEGESPGGRKKAKIDGSV
jgi:hypothetical protein